MSEQKPSELAEVEQELELLIHNAGFDVQETGLRFRLQTVRLDIEATINQRDQFRDQLDDPEAKLAAAERECTIAQETYRVHVEANAEASPDEPCRVCRAERERDEAQGRLKKIAQLHEDHDHPAGMWCGEWPCSTYRLATEPDQPSAGPTAADAPRAPRKSQTP